jgi:hypothetical protein
VKNMDALNSQIRSQNSISSIPSAWHVMKIKAIMGCLCKKKWYAYVKHKLFIHKKIRKEERLLLFLLLSYQGLETMPIPKFRTDLASDSLVIPKPLGQRVYNSL